LLKDEGFVEGENVSIIYRWVEGKNDHLPTLSAFSPTPGVQVPRRGGGVP
jgi:hypothetical protein